MRIPGAERLREDFISRMQKYNPEYQFKESHYSLWLERVVSYLLSPDEVAKDMTDHMKEFDDNFL